MPLTPEQRRQIEEEIEEELADEWEDDGSPSMGAQILRRFGEIRKRILIVFGTMVVAACIAGVYSVEIFAFLIQPLCAAAPATPPADLVAGTAKLVGKCALYPTDPLEPMIVFFKLALLVGLFAAAPVLFYQVWAVIAPYVSRNTKAWVVGFVGTATLFFVGGAAFGFFIVFPPAFQFLLNVGGANIISLPTPASYFSILAMLLLGFGVTFELPLLMFMLSVLGITNAAFYLRYWRHAIVLMFVFSAMITPTTDPMTMMMMGGPLVFLYFAGIAASALARRGGPTLVEQRLRELDDFGAGEDLDLDDEDDDAADEDDDGDAGRG